MSDDESGISLPLVRFPEIIVGQTVIFEVPCDLPVELKEHKYILVAGDVIIGDILRVLIVQPPSSPITVSSYTHSLLLHVYYICLWTGIRHKTVQGHIIHNEKKNQIVSKDIHF